MPRGIPNSRSTDAKNRPVITGTGTEFADQPVGHTVRTEGNPHGATAQERLGDVQMVQVSDRLPDQEKLANLAFMNEEIEIQVAQTTDKNALPFEITINGRTELFRYGEIKKVKRMFADRMLLLKVTSYDTPERVNQDGERTSVPVATTALKYPFHVVRDANPMSRAWYEATMGMAG
jgi:hypothetical protein